MATYFLFGSYSPEALGQVSGDMTEEATALIEKLGGKVKDVYGLLGDYEVVVIVDFPGTVEVMRGSMALSKLIPGIRFKTVPALGVEEFARLFGN
jgi:uncharacterized protein with GYD domain